MFCINGFLHFRTTEDSVQNNRLPVYHTELGMLLLKGYLSDCPQLGPKFTPLVPALLAAHRASPEERGILFCLVLRCKHTPVYYVH